MRNVRQLGQNSYCHDGNVMKLLIAEDQPDFQRTILFLIKGWGYKADIVSNGKEALERASNNCYDICIMDRNMPIMDGFTASIQIRHQSKYFPIIIFSGDHHIAEEKLLSFGIDDFLPKPCNPEDLYRKIREWQLVKTMHIKTNGYKVEINKGMPMDALHAQELKKLKEQGLVKMRLDGPAEREVIAHKNTPNKISHDFNIKKHLMTEFLNRDPDRPTICDLYRGNKSCIVETFIDEEDFTKKVSLEDQEMEKYSTKVFKVDDE
jgi:CheY-like chemotaxis protein